ncbi:transcriptional regulator [Agromyces rhizosphaerae]|uniref:Transcriptional regulator n=1 Tax=Agromyces rhizosphaerae TaxID=88374 RepID=A0A9W6CUX7_9MICO|nr:FCD domain-containing protein [Agromyces rhizosphaerae]GLI26922.1 transcriptional regulator [Agromyces rhizosphaerae]
MSAFERVLDDTGRRIVDGRMPAGSVLTVDALVARHSVSRSIVREAVRVLVSLDLVEARQRVGLRVLPEEAWNVLHPRVIHWRLAGDGAARATQLAELVALRLAVEPAAAEAAALQADGPEASALLDLADRLPRADGPAFLDADQAFHRELLRLSGNRMLQRLGAVIDEALEDRARHVDRPDPHDLALHATAARAIADGRGADAAAALRAIVERTGPPIA